MNTSDNIVIIDKDVARNKRYRDALSGLYNNVICVTTYDDFDRVFSMRKPQIIIFNATDYGNEGYKLFNRMGKLILSKNSPIPAICICKDPEMGIKYYDLGAFDVQFDSFEESQVIAIIVRKIRLALGANSFIKSFNENKTEYKDAIKNQQNEAILKQKQIIVNMAKIIDARGGEHGDHVVKSVRCAKVLVDGMKEKGIYNDILTNKYCSDFMDAVPLHDIGKISISNELLKKKGELTEDEFAVIRSHTTEGGRIIRDFMHMMDDKEWVRMASDIALYHHEKWDGTGYPSRLSGNMIPLSARITSVVDVLDALLRDRVYRKAMTVDEAFDVISCDSGQGFDPEIVKVLLENKDKIKEIYN